ncbi:MAG: hypothetical protein AAGG68_18480 [Bacteroidota bacterium]
MRLTATLFILFSTSAFALAQQQAVPVSHQSDVWLEENENANDAIQFSADALPDAIELFWEVRREEAIVGYELQRSTDGKNFQKVAWIASVGEAEIGGSYLHLDETSFRKEIIQYRIKVVRKDGQYLYSSTQIVDLRLSNKL